MREITQEQFNEETHLGASVVDFYADWCGPCKMISPILEELSAKYIDTKFLKIDADKNPEVLNNFGIMSIPTILLMRDGEIVGRITGFQSKSKLEEKIKNL